MPLKTSPRIQRLLLACCLLFFAVAVVLTVAPVAAQIIIIDDDEVPGTEISADNINVGESEGKVYVKVKLSESAPDTVTVQYQTIDDTAVAPGDYTATNGSLVFAVGETEKTIEITIIDDSAQETNETFSVQLSNPINGELDPNATYSNIKIVDDDGPMPAVEFAVTEFMTGETVGAMTVLVTLSSEYGKDVTVQYATADDTATAPGDYTSANGTLTFTPGQTDLSFQVTIVDDTVAESLEAINLSLTNPTNATLGLQKDSVLTIIDDDPVVLPTVQFSQPEYEFSEGEGTVTVTVELSAPWAEDVTVDYNVTDGTAFEGTDYTAETFGEIVFLAGETQKTVQIELIDDTELEDAETIQLNLSNPQNAALGAVSAATAFIVDDDQPLPAVDFDKSSDTILESDGSAVVTISLSQSSKLPITVACRSFDGTATSPKDYTTVNEFITFSPGETAKTVEVEIIDDNFQHCDRSFTLQLEDPSLGVALGSQSTMLVNITEDDAAAGEKHAAIEPDANQRGKTGDIVASSKGATGQKHYVSPKLKDGYVVLKAKVIKPQGGKFEDDFEWDGGEAGATPDTRKVSRTNTGLTVVKIKLKGQATVVDTMNVWVVWAVFEKAAILDTRGWRVFNGKPPSRPKEIRRLWVLPKATLYHFVAKIEPIAIIDGSSTAGDIPRLDGNKSREVPGVARFRGGVKKRWDVTRRTRTKILNPDPTTIVRADYLGYPEHEIALDAKKNDFPTKSIVLIDYPADELAGNDDSGPNGTDDEDNNPYSAAEQIMVDATKTKITVPKVGVGELASVDMPDSPMIYLHAGDGKKKETVEVRFQFGEFVRLQIGDGNVAGYMNWYRISDFYDWQSIVKYQRTENNMKDNGSVQQLDNGNW